MKLERATTATTMAYFDNYSLASKLHIVMKVIYCQGFYMLSRQLHTVKTVEDCEGNCRLSRCLYCSCRPLQTCLFLSVQ